MECNVVNKSKESAQLLFLFCLFVVYVPGLSFAEEGVVSCLHDAVAHSGATAADFTQPKPSTRDTIKTLLHEDDNK